MRICMFALLNSSSMIRRTLALMLLTGVFACQEPAVTQPESHVSTSVDRPKLVIGIVVDQMRYDYLYRYEHLYGEDGLKRLMREGFHFHNTNYPYIPTYTGPGHASIYTGTTPSIHGIIANNWYDKTRAANMYVSQDDSVEGVGVGGKEGRMSPKNMLTTTLTDEWRLFTQFRSRTIGIALKDRGAILPAGHTANAAYWYDGGSGKWVTSTYYMDTLPQWVALYNEKKHPETYMGQSWETLLPIEAYADVATEDEVSHETPYTGMARTTFPYPLPVLYKKLGNNLIKNTPWGNTITFEMAKEAVINESLGQSGVTDMLTVSFSTPDYLGHQFGPRSVEIADHYLRFDRAFGEFMHFLDSVYGEDEYLMFFTADHGAADAVGFSEAHNIPTGLVQKELEDGVREMLRNAYGTDKLLLSFANLQMYLNDALIAKLKLNKQDVAEAIIQHCRQVPGVLFAQSVEDFLRGEFRDGLRGKHQRGIMGSRSGDVILTMHPAYLEMKWQSTGTTHGSGYSYDTRVPWILYGKGVRAGETFEPVEIIDIAPTISNMLRMNNPNGCSGVSRLPLMN